MSGMRVLWRGLLALAALPVLALAETPAGYQRVGVATRRIERDRQTVSIYQGAKRLELPHFLEMVVIKPVSQPESLRRLLGTRVLLVPSDKRRDEWNVFGEPAETSEILRPVSLVLGQVDPLTLPDNVYRVRLVIVSTAKNPVAVHAGSEVYQLTPGEALLVLD